MTLSNQGAEPLPPPELQAYYMLDDKVKVEAKVIRTDASIGLQPQGEAKLQVIGHIPYTADFGTVKLVLQGKDKGADNTEKLEDLVELSAAASSFEIPAVPVGEVWSQREKGRSYDLQVKSVDTYQGSTADTLAIQLVMSNREPRHQQVGQRVAFLKTADGTLFPAKLSEVKDKIAPEGKALLLASVTLPKGYRTDGAQLVVGDAVVGGAISGTDVGLAGPTNSADTASAASSAAASATTAASGSTAASASPPAADPGSERYVVGRIYSCRRLWTASGGDGAEERSEGY
ncbi:hypothetical protein LJK88_28585 [Paenibacillus sp. P26]|nr:hypothetical protein LJK88_28585 [Paenibacillus sp. P26]